MNLVFLTQLPFHRNRNWRPDAVAHAFNPQHFGRPRRVDHLRAGVQTKKFKKKRKKRKEMRTGRRRCGCLSEVEKTLRRILMSFSWSPVLITGADPFFGPREPQVR